MPETAKYLGISEAAREIGIAATTLRWMMKEGRIAYVRGPYGRVLEPAVVAAEKRRRDKKKAG